MVIKKILGWIVGGFDQISTIWTFCPVVYIKKLSVIKQ